MKYLSEITALYNSKIKPYLGNPKGSSLTEIKELENKLAAKLPQAYTEFLLWMGSDKDGVFRGSDYWIDCVLSNNEYLPELLDENQIDYQLPKSYVTFFMHQGYMAAWFELPAQFENPESFFFSEGKEFFKRKRGWTFTDFIMSEMNDCAELFQKLDKKEKK